MTLFRRPALAAFALFLVSACGTSFVVPELTPEAQTEARAVFLSTQSEGARPSIPRAAAEARFRRVARRVAPVGARYCAMEQEQRPDLRCDVDLGIDYVYPGANAYQTFDRGQPVIRFSMPLLQKTRNDHEVAFILGHEYAHLLARHIEKTEQQALVGALIGGAIGAAVDAHAVSYGADPNPGLITDSVNAGLAIGSLAYSQTYELESDTLGTHIAHAAGYDPEIGARFFALDAERTEVSGARSFWGTHPADETRIATVISTMDQIRAGQGLRRTAN